MPKILKSPPFRPFTNFRPPPFAPLRIFAPQLTKIVPFGAIRPTLGNPDLNFKKQMFHLKVFSYSYIDGVVHGYDCNGFKEQGVAKSRPQRPRLLLCHNRTFGEPRLLRWCCCEKRHIHRDLVLVVRFRLLVCGLQPVVQLASHHVGFTN